MNTYFQLALNQVNQQLNAFANSWDFWSKFELAFGNSYSRDTAINIKGSLSNQTFSIPQILIVSDDVLGNASGAFDSSTGNIYLKESLVTSGNLQLTSSVIIEEIGHWIDSKVNIQDSIGDEGQIFSNLVRGNILTSSELIQLKAENDTAIIQIDGQNITVQQSNTNFDYGDALTKSVLFYEAQRSGQLPPTNRVPWRGNSALTDGSDVGIDLTGGYYDAGDHVKFGFPMASAMTMLGWGAIQYRTAYEQSGQIDEVMDAIRQGTEYIKKANVVVNGKTTAFWGQVGDGNTDHSYWGAPENMTMVRPSFKIDAAHPGSDLAAESAAALAAASILFRPTDASYANELLQHAKQLYDFADDSDPNDSGPKKRGKYSDPGGLYKPNSSSYPEPAKLFYNSSGYEDELGWGALWLYKATKAANNTDATYLAKAKTYFDSVYLGSSATQETWTQTWDDKKFGGMVLISQEIASSHYTTQLEDVWLKEWTDKNQVGTVKYTSGGLAWINEWGSLRYTANTAFVAGVYADTAASNVNKAKYSSFAQEQVDYILGNNPNNFSYMVGFGNNFPQNPHHRAASGTTSEGQSGDNVNDIIGALVGGPEQPNDSAYSDVRTNYKGNEVALDFNAGLTGVLARQYGLNPDVKIAVAPATVTEDGVANLVYTFTRTGVTTNPLTVNFSVIGTATFNNDYIQTGAASFTGTTGTITFASGSGTASITINPTADTTPETNETVVLTLASGSGYRDGNINNSVTLLSDNFNTENTGFGLYNFNQLNNWTVIDGTVDLLGTGFEQDLIPGNGLYLDLDGTSNNAGRIESKSTFSFNAGDQVTLSFYLAGSQRGDSNSVTVSLGNLFTETFTRNSSDPLTKITRNFVVSTPTSSKLIFDHLGGDNLGLLLDNVELINQTKSAIGTIINDDGNYQVKPIRNDFDNDKKSDILWRNNDGSIALWQMNGGNILSADWVSAAGNLSWKIVGTGDFNGDSKSDVLWRDIYGSVALWQMNGAAVLSSNMVASSVDSNWEIVGTGDFNGDGKSDILWRDVYGSVAIWQMDGVNIASGQSIATAVSNSWKISGTGDFNGDNKSDILWRNDNGQVAIWLMNGNAISSAAIIPGATTDWKIQGIDDFNGDDKSDILWRNDNGTVALWQINGLSLASAAVISIVPIDWKIAGTGDYNGDRKGDILWRNNNGADAIWFMNGASTISSSLIGSVDLSWKIVAPII
jgi:Glycosyl hydrolase family 9/FG-GAP-like repeat